MVSSLRIQSIQSCLSWLSCTAHQSFSAGDSDVLSVSQSQLSRFVYQLLIMRSPRPVSTVSYVFQQPSGGLRCDVTCWSQSALPPPPPHPTPSIQRSVRRTSRRNYRPIAKKDARSRRCKESASVTNEGDHLRAGCCYTKKPNSPLKTGPRAGNISL